MLLSFECKIWLCILFPVFWVSCGDIVPTWVGEQSLEDYTLRKSSQPCVFPMIIDPIGDMLDLRMEMEITYDVGIGRNNLPLRLLIIDPAKDRIIKEVETTVTLKAGGEWLGIPKENEIDYTITHNAIPHLKIKPGNYLLQVYANDRKQEKIYGIVSITARLYEVV